MKAHRRAVWIATAVLGACSAADDADVHAANAHDELPLDPPGVVSPTEPKKVEPKGNLGGDPFAPEVEAPLPNLYDPDTIPRFELTLAPDAVAVLSSPNTDDKDTWVHGAFKFGDRTFADVGVRRKGSSTLRALPAKTSLKIKFNKWVKKQKLGGLEELTLNNNASDQTYLEQRLAYHVFRAMGLPAPLANSAELTINGEYYGVFTNVETPDEKFLARAFGAKARSLYEAAGGAAWLPGSDARWDDDVPAPDEPEGTRTDVHALFRAMELAKDETLLRDLEGHLHTKRYLRFCGAEAITGHHDGYAYGHYESGNYFMAGDVDGKFTLVPWSTDGAFVASSGDDIDVAAPVPEDLLLARCRRNPGCWDSYKQEVAAMLDELDALDLLATAKKWHEQIDPLVKADPKLETSVSYFESMTEKTYAWIEGRAALVRSQLGLPTP